MASNDPRPVLILNTGSSTFKWALLSDDEQFVGTGSEEWEAEDALTRKAQIEARLRAIPPCRAVGHRIVQGGLVFEDSVVIDDAVRRDPSQVDRVRPHFETLERDAPVRFHWQWLARPVDDHEVAVRIGVVSGCRHGDSERAARGLARRRRRVVRAAGKQRG